MNYSEVTLKKDKLISKLLSNKSDILIQNLEDWFRVELTFSSNALEGNTLTRQETALVLEKGIAIGGKSLREHLEATNHGEALDWIKERAKGEKYLQEKDILEIHHLILKTINDENSGKYRNVSVRISGSSVIFPNPLKVSQLMEEFVKWINEGSFTHPVEKSLMAHYRLVTIHPFVDGNGRTGRLLMNLILLQNGYPPAIIRKRDRLTYIKSLEEAQLGGSIEPYKRIIINSIERSLDIYLNILDDKVVHNEHIKKPNSLLRIGEVSKLSNETVSTIRFWTKEGLLKIQSSTESGYQLYDPIVTEHIKLIRHLQNQRKAIQEIKEKFLKNDNF